MKTASDFFYEHAGYSYDPKTETPEQGRRRCADILADAESIGTNAGWSCSWEIDPHCDSSEFSDDPEPWPLWICRLYNARAEIVDTVGCIDFGRNGQPWGDPYRRVVEAEMFADYLASL